MPVTNRALSPIMILIPVLLGLLVTPAVALLYIDFEQPYYVHPFLQVWDHCLVESDGVYHIFYHGMPEATPDPQFSDHIWHSTSPDLIHWTEPQIVLSVSEEPHETLAVWAPDVVWDPGSGLWWMSYTGVDDQRNQRICMAWSADLEVWEKNSFNPVVEPDPANFFYYPDFGWAECRDPYLYWDNGMWNMLVSAKIPGIEEGQGTLAHATSVDLSDWSALDVFLLNDGPGPVNPLESPQYVLRDGYHHVFFHQYTTAGITHISALDPQDWHLDDANQIDLGIAPEVETFDGGAHYILTRIAPYQEPDRPNLSYVARLDTLNFRDGDLPPLVYRAPPLLREFESYAGNACLGNPCFGDNPARRGEEPVNLEGYWFFGSREYFQGPLSGRGDTGRLIGDTAQGWLETAPFVVEGASLSFLCSGTYSPDHCFVALMDAATDSVLRQDTGYGTEPMTRRYWDLLDLQGVEVYLRIEDSDPVGHINVDHIVESLDLLTVVEPESVPGGGLLTDLGPRPNPFNPVTELRFALASATPCRVRIHDLRGRLVWDSGSFAGREGANAVTWRGVDTAGTPAPAGVYVYGIAARGRTLATGKVSLVP